VGRWDDHRKAEDHDCQWASVHDFPWEAGRDCRLASVAEVARRGEKALRLRGAVHPAEPVRDVVDPEPEDVEQANRREHFVQRAAKAGRAEQERPGVGRKELGCAAQQGRRVLQLPEKQERRELPAAERLGPLRIREPTEQAHVALQPERMVQRAWRQLEQERRQLERQELG
jgi:hypothetical protein